MTDQTDRVVCPVDSCTFRAVDLRDHLIAEHYCGQIADTATRLTAERNRLAAELDTSFLYRKNADLYAAVQRSEQVLNEMESWAQQAGEASSDYWTWKAAADLLRTALDDPASTADQLATYRWDQSVDADANRARIPLTAPDGGPETAEVHLDAQGCRDLAAMLTDAADHVDPAAPGKACGNCEGIDPATCLVCRPPAAGEPQDTCRTVEVDGEPVHVRGAGEMTDLDRKYFAEVVRAAKRLYLEEHPEAAEVPAQSDAALCDHCAQLITGPALREWTGPAGNPYRSWHADRLTCRAAALPTESMTDVRGRCPATADEPVSDVAAAVLGAEWLRLYRTDPAAAASALAQMLPPGPSPAEPAEDQ